MTDWREGLLAAVRWAAPVPGAGLRRGRLALAVDGRARCEVTVAVWDFTVAGGSFGQADATAFVAATEDAARDGTALVSFLRSGGTRLPEGMRALVGMARVTLALSRLSARGLPHLAVLDQPTTGGVFVTVGARADLRVAVRGATVGFAGPRVVEAVTGSPVTGSHRAETAYDAGLVDAVLAGGDVADWVASVAEALSGRQARPCPPPAPAPDPGRDAWRQVGQARGALRPTGAQLLVGLLPAGAALRGPDPGVAARVGRLSTGQSVVAVALAADRGARPGPAGFGVLTRAAGLAGRLGLPLITLIDTPGAEPGSAAENAGVAAAIGTAMDAVLSCPSPTLAVLHGEGGSGGALAAAVCDRVLVTPEAYFAALVPEGAAAALRSTPAEAAAVMEPTPATLLALGVADALVAADELPAAVRWHARELALADPALRWRDRVTRWSGPTAQPGHPSG